MNEKTKLIEEYIIVPSMKKSNDGIIQLQPSIQKNSICFYDNNKEIGKLEFDEQVAKFTGNADASAKIFFDAVISTHNEYIKQLKNTIAEKNKEIRELKGDIY